jgi:hypothetical protein
MIENGFDYDRTVKTQRLVFKGQRFQEITSYIFQFIIIVFGLTVSYFILKSQLENNPSLTDYLVAVFFPVMILALTIFECKILLTRDKLKEIVITQKNDNTRVKLLEAAKNLNWRADIISDKHIVFVTKFGFVKDCQTATLIFFPGGRIFFNSINYPNDYIRQSRFMENYQALMTEYFRIEKD